MSAAPPPAALPPADELYRRYAGMVRRRVGRFYDDPEAADVVHEVFEQVLRKADSFRGGSTVRTWLYQVTTRHCLVRRRNARRRRELFEQYGAPGWSRAVRDPSAETVTFLNQLWRTLDPELAEIGMYYYVDGMRQADIGELLGVSGRTISNRLATLARAASAAAEEGP